MSECVSIIIPVYNMAASLESAAHAIQKQDYDNYEIILVDDGSTDDSLAICRRLAAEDTRIKYFHEENSGAGPARNLGIQNSKGRYLYFPDADDYLEPDAITKMVTAMDGGRFDLVVFGYKNVNQNGDVISTTDYKEHENTGDRIRANYLDYFNMGRPFAIQGAPWNKFFDGNVVRENGVEFPPLKRHQDEGFISRYMCFAKNVHFIPEVLYTYYTNSEKKEWQKYPVNYIDAVMGLYQVWQETICTWNPADTATQNHVKEEYLSKVVKALELSYSPKMELTKKTRPAWLKETCEKTKIAVLTKENCCSIYVQALLWCAQKGHYRLMAFFLNYGRMKMNLVQG